MNYFNSIIKILEKPKQTIINNEIYITRFFAQYATMEAEKSEPIIQIAIWGNFLEDISTYFFVGNYIIIEGYISFRDAVFNEKNSFTDKQIEISVFKVYPFLF